jgi:hypothetical protein
MSIHIVAHGVFVYPASALCINVGAQSSSVLLNHLRGLVQRGIGHRQQPGLSGVGEFGVASTGAHGATDFREVASVGGAPSSVILGVMLAVMAALAIGLFLLLACPLQRGTARPGLQRSRDSPRKGREGECSEAEEPEYARLPSSLAQSASTLHDAAGGSDREDRPSMVSMPSLPQAPLCPQLIVPDTSSLRAVLPMLACRARQDVVLNICSVPDLGGRPLFRARISETGPASADGCGIHLESLCGEHCLAFASTAELWASPAAPAPNVPLLRSNGLQFGTMKKNHTGDYVVICGMGTLAVFSGSFLLHDIQVISGQGKIMADVRHDSDGSYEVTTSPSIDAGLIILGLLIIDKFERTDGRERIAQP